MVTRYSPARVKRGEMLSVEDIQEILSIPLLGVIPESTAILHASNKGVPITLDEASDAKVAYCCAVASFLGEEAAADKGWKFLKSLKSYLGVPA